MPLPKPEFKNVKDLYDAVSADWSDLHAQDEEMERLRDMTYHVPFTEPQGVEGYQVQPIRSGWTRAGIRAFKGMFSDKPRFRHDPGLSAPSHRQSERIEGFLNTAPWAIEAAFGPFWEPSVEDCGVFGRGWVEVLPKLERWASDPDYPRKGKGIDPETGKDVPANESKKAYEARREKWKKDALPAIRIRHLAADSVYALITEHYRVLQAVRYVEITLAEAAVKWPKQFEEAYNDEGNDPTDEVRTYEYVDEEWHAQAAEYKDIKELVQEPYRHHMKMCPWVLVEALTNASSDPNKRWEPYLKQAKAVGIAMDAQLTRKATITELWPFPQPVIEDPNKAEDPEKSHEYLELKPPMALYLYGGKTFRIENWGGWEPEAENLWNKFQRALDRMLPDVGAEIAEGSSGTPAWTWRLRGQMQDRDMKGAIDALSLSAKRIGQAILRAIQSKWIDETVYIGRETKEGTEPIKLSPKDIEGQINRIDASVSSKKLIDRNADLGAMKMAIDMGLGMRWAGENLADIENMQEVMDEALLEKIEYSEPMIQQLQLDVMERADLIEAREATVPPEEVARMLPFLPPGVQAAIRNVQMPGLGRGGVPVGAHPITMTRTGVGTATPGGPTPYAREPGGPTEFET